MQVSGEVPRPRAYELATQYFNFNHAPFTVVQTTGTNITLRNEVGVQLNRNTAVVKKCSEHNDVANGNGDQVEQVPRYKQMRQGKAGIRAKWESNDYGSI